MACGNRISRRTILPRAVSRGREGETHAGRSFLAYPIQQIDAIRAGRFLWRSIRAPRSGRQTTRSRFDGAVQRDVAVAMQRLGFEVFLTRSGSRASPECDAVCAMVAAGPGSCAVGGKPEPRHTGRAGSGER